MGTVGLPVHPCELVERRDALQSVVTSGEDGMLSGLFWEDELNAGDGGECFLYDGPKDVSDRLWAINRTIKVPATEL